MLHNIKTEVMQTVQFIQVTPEQLKTSIIQGVKVQLEDLKKSFQPKEPTSYLTVIEVAKLIQVDKSTVYNLTKKGTLIKYQIGGRVLYKRHEVEAAIVKLDK